MPYFKWTGVMIDGMIRQGKSPAYSPDELSVRLFKQGIALLRCKTISTFLLFKSINSLDKGHLCSRVAQLLKAGIMLPEALILTAQQTTHPSLYDSLFSCAMDIQQGKSFSYALENQKKLYDSVAITMLKAGYESGDLADAFDNVARYYAAQHEFYKKVRSALAMPLITLLFFIMISLFIFIVIMPRFADMFASLQQELPPLTRIMLSISSFMCSKYMIMVCVGLAIGYCVLKKLFRNSSYWFIDTIVYYIPFVKQVFYYHYLSQLCNALSLLLMSGVSLSLSLHTVIESVSMVSIKRHFIFLYNEVQAGRLLSEAMVDSAIFEPDVIAVTHVGEESGSIAPALQYASSLYRDMLQQKLGRIIFFLQPCMIIFLGLLITALIFSVYLPVMEMSRAL